jgi:hypothetical protein
MEKDSDDSFEALCGRCLNSWRAVEAWLGYVFVVAMDCRDKEHADMVFNAAMHSAKKIRMTDKICRHILEGDALLDQWNVIYKELESCKTLRNHLVHWDRVFIWNPTKPIKEVLFKPSDLRLQKNINDLRHMKNRFVSTFQKLVSFHGDLKKNRVALRKRKASQKRSP